MKMLKLFVVAMVISGLTAKAQDFYEFIYAGNTYRAYTNTTFIGSWQDAAFEASFTDIDGEPGYLAHIGSQAENDAIIDALTNNIPSSYWSNSTATDGGGGAYFFIGGNDISTEGTWIFDGDNDSAATEDIGTGEGTNGADNWVTAPGAYANFSVAEPDDFGGSQDALAISLDGWPFGSPGQWNDIDVNNSLFYLVEYNTDIPVTYSSSWDHVVMAGEHNGWTTQPMGNPSTPMTLITNYTWATTVTVSFATATNWNFKFVANGGVSGFSNAWGDSDAPTADVPFSGTAELADGGNIVYPPVIESGTYLVTFNEQSGNYTMETISNTVLSVAVSGSFNGNDPSVDPLSEITPGSNAWQGVIDVIETDPSFTFVVNGYANEGVFGDDSAASTTLDLSDTWDADGAAINITGALTNSLEFTFDLDQGTYSVVNVGTAAVALSDWDHIVMAGEHNGWVNNPSGTPLTLVDDYTWETTVTVSSITNWNFKFVANSAWSNAWGDSDAPISSIPFSGTADLTDGGNIVYPAEIVSGTYLVTFNEQSGNYSLTTVSNDIHTVYVAGAFNGWATAQDALSRIAPGTNAFEGTFTITAGAGFPCKFLANGYWNEGSWGDDNLSSGTLPISDTWDSDGGDIVVNGPVNGDVRFLIDLDAGTYEIEQVSMSTNDIYTAVTIPGTFNGWDNMALNMTSLGSNQWEAVVPLNSSSNLGFKYVTFVDAAFTWLGDSSPSGTTVPVTGTMSEAGGDVILAAPLSGNYLFEFDALTGAFSVTRPTELNAMIEIFDIDVTTTNVWLSWTAESGTMYEVESTTNLVTGPWVSEGMFTASDTNAVESLSLPAVDHTIYRVKLNP